MGKSGGVKCAIKSCGSVYSNNHNRTIRFFRFPNPRHEIQINQWKRTCNDDTIMMADNEKLYRSKRICSLHFEAHMMNKYQLKKDAIPTLNLEVSSATSLYEEHSYFRNENLEVGCYLEIDSERDDCSVSDHRMNVISRSIGTQINDCSIPDNRLNVISRSIGTQTDLVVRNRETQTSYINKSDCQIQTEVKLSARTPRKLKLMQELKDQKAKIKVLEKENARLLLLYDKQFNQEEEILIVMTQ